ncbi:MAG: pyridoxal phosphate-dependent aminotransferase [Candidatus Thorarchaeota archaeon]|nr:MAG: pyridoxal phosphate-dependent aminotransferase [Candidatus Thorarchaeota archaeon]
MERIPESGTLKMYELASRLEAEGKTVYHFEVGQPDFPTPPNIVEAAIQALKDGETRYTSSRGIPTLLDAIQDHYSKRGIEINGQSDVIVTPGAKMALFQGVLSTIDAGDDVLLLAPAWPTYRVMIRISGAKPRDVPTQPGYELDEEALKAHISKSVSALVINSPNNPSGGLLAKEQMKLILDLAMDHDFVIFSDEIYESLVYDGLKQASMLEVDPSMERTLVVSGFSKSYSMTGWRLGYAVGNQETIGNMVRIQQNTTSCASSFVQHAGVEALTGDQSRVEAMRAAFESRRNRIVQLLEEMEGVHCVNPRGAFYAFPDFSSFGLSCGTLAELILKKTGVTTVPGDAFGKAYNRHLRFSYATSLQVIEEGLGLLSEYLPSLR